MNKSKIFVRIIVAVLVIALAAAFCLAAGCRKGDSSRDYVATVDGIKITRPVFGYAFNIAANELYASGEISFDKFATEEFITMLKETKNGEGKTYYDVFTDSIMEHAQEYLISESLAREGSDWPDDSTLHGRGTNLKESLESTYAYYIQYYGYTLDLICMQKYGLNLNDFMDLFPRSEAVDRFVLSWESELHPTEEQLEQFYNEHKEDYRIVTVRHSLISTSGLTDAEKADALAEARSYVEAVKNGTKTFDEIVALSDDSGVSTNNGYYDVTATGTYVKPFLDWAVARTSLTDIPEIVETTYGYHLMICTAIKEYDDESVQSGVKTGWLDNEFEKMIEEKTKDSRYEIKDMDRSVLDKFMRMFCLMTFDDPEEGNATEAPQTSPTAKPEYNDEPLSSDVVAKVADRDVLYPELVYLFGESVTDIVGDSINFDDDATRQERYEYFRAFLEKEYEDSGMSYLEKIKEHTKELLLKFSAAYIMALEKMEPYSEEKLKSMNDEIDSAIDYYLAYAGEYYGVSTRDEYMKYVMGMNVNDYKYFNAVQSFLSEYAEKVMSEMTPTSEELFAFYNENEESYRVVAVRHIYLSFDDNGDAEEPGEERKTEVRTQAQTFVDKILVDGDSPEAVVRAWSQAEDATSTGGIVNVSSSTDYFNDEITAWIMGNETVGTDTMKVFETEDGIEIVYVTGILTFEGLTGETGSEEITHEKLLEAVTTAYKNDLYDKNIDQYVADHSLELKEVNEKLINKAVDDYLRYEEDSQES